MIKMRLPPFSGTVAIGTKGRNLPLTPSPLLSPPPSMLTEISFLQYFVLYLQNHSLFIYNNLF